MKQLVHRIGVTVTCGLILLARPAAANVGLETFVIATDGQKTISTGGPVQSVQENFGNFVAVSANATTDPTQLALVGIDGTYRVSTAVGNTTLSDSESISGTGQSSFGNWSYSGNTSATARPSQLKSQAQAAHTGNSDNGTMNNAASYAKFTETLRAASNSVPSGMPGIMRLEMTIDGSMTVTGTGTVGMIFRYGYGISNPVMDKRLVETFAYSFQSGYDIYGPHSYIGSFVSPPGMDYDIGALNGSGQPDHITYGGTAKVYADIPMTFGLDTEFRMGLLTFTGIGNGTGMMDDLFGDTATMTGVQIFDNNGQEVHDFSLTSGSGAFYDAQGVHFAVVPEPGTLALLLPVLGIAPLLRRRKA